ncbi:MAG: CotH kinase family protein, partial [Treponema sp.]|nr:CotH kinase family protein [Treponema sp.]
QEIFAPEKAVAVIDAMEAEVEPLYADKVARWGASGYSVTSWKSSVENRRKFLRERGGYFLDNVRSAFGIGEAK